MTPEQLMYLSHVRPMNIIGDHCLVRIPEGLMLDHESDAMDDEQTWRLVLSDCINLLVSGTVMLDHLVIGTRRICNVYFHMRHIPQHRSLLDLRHDVTAVMYQMVENLRESGKNLQINWVDADKTMFVPRVKLQLFPEPQH